MKKKTKKYRPKRLWKIFKWVTSNHLNTTSGWKILFESTANSVDFLIQNMCYVQSQGGFHGFKSDPPSKSFGSNTDNEEMVNVIL